MSKGVSNGISNGWGKMVIGFAPAYGDKLFCELYWMDVTNGFTGEAYRTNEIIVLTIPPFF